MKTIFACLLLLFVAGGCMKEKQTGAAHDHSQHAAATEQYTCPMHPEIKQDTPGTCPVCGMDLVQTSAASSVDIMFNDTQMKLANITTQKVSSKHSGRTFTANGRLILNEEGRTMVSNRVTGRIEKLFIKEEGRPVRKGQALYQIASDELFVAQQEYLVASQQAETPGKEQQRYQSYLDAAEKKLLLYGLTAEQIGELRRTRSVKKLTTFSSPASGTVGALNVREGQYVSEGSPLYQIENTNTLWLEIELYEDEARQIDQQAGVSVLLSGQSLPIASQVSFFNPEFRNNTQVIVARARVDNSSHSLTAGMQAQVTFSVSGRNGITVPLDAVVRTAKGNHVFVQTGKNTFQRRWVTTGTEESGRIQITEGLMENEVIAASGAYLIYSELVLKHADALAL